MSDEFKGQIMKTKPLQTGFSAADARYPELHASGGELHLRFKDWREHEVHVTFHDVIAYKWQEAEESDLTDDVCEVIGSAWLDMLRQAGPIPQGSAYRHFCFNFNACGQLDVVCMRFVEE